MTVANPARRRVALCARCGAGERFVEADGNVTNLCGPCHHDAKPEIAMAYQLAPERPRTYLVQQLGWKGGRWT